jgi:protein involved in polysaccharide export with SLBB domain
MLTVLLSIFLWLPASLSAQAYEDLSSVRVEELSDAQVRGFILEATRSGMNINQMDPLLIQRGMSIAEISKLKTRIQAMDRNALRPANDVILNRPGARQLQDSLTRLEMKPLMDYNQAFAELTSRNFGFAVFNNPRISFEPNLKIPTPKNYQLSVNDELLIDVSGNSEANYALKVSPEGVIRIPVAGPVQVNGLTIEQAKKAITQKLSTTIYTAIRTGKTTVDVTLGSIRSINVIVIGEANLPGTYTLPSLATAFHALYACGGPGPNGSFRNIQVIRNNTTVAELDIYEYLVTGNRKKDIRLMDQDVIKINSYEKRIELKGEVKKPGLYDVAAGETVKTIISYAGGFTDQAYTSRIQVYRNTATERKISTVTEDELSALVPEKGDNYVVGKILNRFANRISLSGAVYRPGEYELKEGMTLKALINQADGFREDAFTDRGNIHRLKPDLSPEIVSFDLGKVMNGTMRDIILQKEDKVIIYSKFDLKEAYYIKIEGEVTVPGTYLFEEGMQIQDLILMAGGLKESSSLKKIELSRRVKDTLQQDPEKIKTAIIFQQDFNLGLKDSAGLSPFPLQPFDEVVIRAAPGYFVQKNVVIEGEVLYGGKYTLQAKNDRISDLVKRSGGFTSEAYIKGAVLVRTRNFTKTEQANLQQGVRNLVKQNLESGVATEIIKAEVTDFSLKKSDIVGISLEEILKAPGSKFDLLLNDGDTLRIPKQLQTVRVNGEVLYPTLVRYDRNLNFKDYIINSGGFSDRASRKNSYIIHPNGLVKGTTNFLFFKNYPGVNPGSEIYIPSKRPKERLGTAATITIMATIVSMFALVITALK